MQVLFFSRIIKMLVSNELMNLKKLLTIIVSLNSSSSSSNAEHLDLHPL